jgi:hypothetical protein
MKYKRTYKSGVFTIKVFSDSLDVFRLIEHSLDLPHRYSSKPAIEVSFYIRKFDRSSYTWYDNILRRKRTKTGGSAFIEYGDRIAAVNADPKTRMVNADIFEYRKELDPLIWNTVFMDPLRFILASYGYFFLHAAVVHKDGKCALIAGPTRCGKTTLSLVLAKKGFDILSDDDCFIKRTGKCFTVFPFPRKAGLNKQNFERHPWLRKYLLADFTYAGKRRVPLSTVFARPKNMISCSKCIMILLPRFRKGGAITMKSIPPETVMGIVDKGSQYLFTKKQYQAMFWSVYDFIRQADSYRLIHNDITLYKAAELIEAHFKAFRS